MNDIRPILIVQNCEIESAGLILPVLDSLGFECRVVQNWAGEKIPSLGEFSGMINLGCPESANDYSRHEFLGDLFKSVEEAVKREIPYLGICCGGQILSLVLGGRVTRNRAHEIGSYTVCKTEAANHDPWLGELPDAFPVFHWHAETFSIPEGGTLLVTGDDCINQAFRHGNAVGLQFHLEADPAEIPAWCEKYAEELVQIGKTAAEVVTAHTERIDVIKQLNQKLLASFVSETERYSSK